MLIVLASLTYAAIQTLDSFSGETNPFDATISSGINSTFFIPLKRYGNFSNVSINIDEVLGANNISNLKVYVSDKLEFEAPDFQDRILAYYTGDVNGTFPDATGQYSGTTVYSADNVNFTTFAKINGAYNFSDGYIGLPTYDNTFDGIESYSWSVWIYPINNSGINRGIIYTKQSFNTEILIDGSGTRGIRYILTLSGNTIDINTGSAITTNKWTHLVVTFNSSGTKTGRIYIDGVLNASDTGAGTTSAASSFSRLGKDGGTGQFLGRIDEVALWNRTLKANEILDLYNRQLINASNAQYPFNQSGVKANFSLDVDNINSIIADGCTCTNCSLSGAECNLPITFLSTDTGSMQVNLTNSTYEWGLDNCSIYNTSAFNIETKDEETNDLISTNVSFVYSFSDTSDLTNLDTFSVTMDNQNNYSFCKFPSYFNPIGDMSHSMSAGGYETRSFIRINTLFTGSFIGFLIQTSATVQTILFKIVDTTLASVEGASMAFVRVIDSIPTIVESGVSDFAGQVSVPLDSLVTYQIQINASGFPFKTLNLIPVLSSYTIRLNATGDTLFNNNYQGIRYRIIPPGRTFNVTNKFINFTFEVQGSNLEYFGMNFSRHSFECIPTNCQNISTSETGGIVSVKIKVNETGRFYTNLFFKKEGQSEIQINNWPNDGVIVFKAKRSAIILLDEIKDEVGPIGLAVFAAIIQIVLIGIAVQVGIVGVPLILIGAASVMILSIPSIGLINPLFGAFLAITGFIMYALLAMVGRQ